MSVREYIGARYVPIFANPLTWDNTRDYEPLTIVQYQGNSYTSRQYVPIGIDILNEAFWALTGNYNAQVEQYRTEVQSFNNRITENTSNIATLSEIIPDNAFSANNTVKDYIDNSVATINNNISAINEIIPNSAFSTNNTVKDYIDNSVANVNTLNQNRVFVIIGDSWSDDVSDPSNPWYETVANKMNADYVVNVAYRATGYAATTGTTSFYNQVANAVAACANAGYTVEDVSHVIMLGGINDYRFGSTAANTATGIKNTYNAAVEAFPNAKIYPIFGTVGEWSSMDSGLSSIDNPRTEYGSYPYFITLINKYCKTEGIPVITNDVGAWLNVIDYNSGAGSAISPYSTDRVHPTQDGHNIIASYVLQILNGTYDGIEWSAYNTISTATGGQSMTLQWSLKIAHGVGVLKFTCGTLADAPQVSMAYDLSSFIPYICGGNDAKNKINSGSYWGGQTRFRACACNGYSRTLTLMTQNTQIDGDNGSITMTFW